jgi:prolyl-tRNA synthetase
MAEKITSKSEDYSKWYLDVIGRAQLAEDSPVRGCMIIRPYGFALWENIRDGLDRRFKETGHVNASFPLLIPVTFLAKEAEHVDGFAKECAVVTHHRLIAGGENGLIPDPEAKLEVPLVIRPTSETIIGWAFANWVQSYRDLPILVNQWANVVRWELRTRPFLRTTEFHWQEGHTAHATEAEAVEETLRMLDVYADFAINDAAIPVVKGRKSARERFAGAVDTYAIEAMMGNGWALQAGTSHYLGTNFAKAFEIKFLDRTNTIQYCHTTSWGLSTRMVGAVIMAHGDDQGLRLPPKVAPTQAVIVPIWRKEPERGPVVEMAERVRAALAGAGVRVKIDLRDDVTPGFKFNDWEMRGVPVRVEIGPRDVEQDAVVLARRDIPGKEGKQFGVPAASVGESVTALLGEIQANLLRQATEYRDANTTHGVSSYDEFKQVLEGKGGFIRTHWAGSDEDEDRVKDDTKATIRCFPFDPDEGEGVCFLTGKKTNQVALFARAY